MPSLEEDESLSTIYEPLLDGINTRKSNGYYLPLLRALRCIIMIVFAMIYDNEEYAPIQVFVYLLLAFTTAIYFRHDNPFTDVSRLHMETFNEGMITLMSSFALL